MKIIKIVWCWRGSTETIWEGTTEKSSSTKTEGYYEGTYGSREG